MHRQQKTVVRNPENTHRSIQKTR